MKMTRERRKQGAEMDEGFENSEWDCKIRRRKREKHNLKSGGSVWQGYRIFLALSKTTSWQDTTGLKIMPSGSLKNAAKIVHPFSNYEFYVVPLSCS